MAEPSSPSPKSADTADTAGGPRANGAPIAKDAIDPELIKLGRPRPKVGMITALGISALCVLFYVRLSADRRFASSGDEPRGVSVADVLAGKVEIDELVSISAEPLMAHAVLASTSTGQQGLRVVPARGTGDRLWLVLPGDPRSPVSEAPYVNGRLRRLADLPFTADIAAHLRTHPRPVFATPAAVRAALGQGKLATVTGDQLAIRDADEVAVDLVDLEQAVVVASFSDRWPDAATWAQKLVEAGVLTAAQTAPQAQSDDTARFFAAGAPTEVAQKLEKAGLWAARVEPVLRSLRGTWGELRSSGADKLRVGGADVVDAHIDLVGVMAARDLPTDALAVVTGEAPRAYWYIRPISYALLAFAAFFAWVLVRAVRRDLLPAKA